MDIRTDSLSKEKAFPIAEVQKIFHTND